jgi:hypothetical protein
MYPTRRMFTIGLTLALTSALTALATASPPSAFEFSCGWPCSCANKTS